ncbi:MAG: hypothetical protein LBC71_04165 [Oscillospiraceae bacterium]|jgi:predicted aldo/keto reductase-like oxidoreductase|nr:hypothetical protein [Oscillospiraceae bacterium]
MNEQQQRDIVRAALESVSTANEILLRGALSNLITYVNRLKYQKTAKKCSKCYVTWDCATKIDVMIRLTGNFSVNLV